MNGEYTVECSSKTLSKHDWSFCGPPIPHRQWSSTVSNKTFASIAAGVPQLIYQAEATEKLLGDKGVGVVIKDLDEIKDCYYDMKLSRDLKDSILQNRHQWTMESQLPALEELYQKVIDTNLD